MHRLKKIPSWFISLIFYILTALFLFFYLRDIDFSKLRNIDFSWQPFALSLVVGLSYLFFGAFIWRVILKALGASTMPSYRSTTVVYARAWMGRYIPGTVTWIAGKVFLARSWGISKSRLSVASLLEGGSQLLATVFTAFILFGLDDRSAALSPTIKYALLGLGFLVLLVLLPIVFNRIMAIGFKIIGRRAAPEELRVNGKAVSQAFGLYIVGSLVYGVGSFLVIAAVAPGLEFHDIGYVIGAVGLSTVAGMAAPFAPSGLGIKDGLLLVLLSALLPKEVALTATIYLRLWSIIIDILFLAISNAIGSKQLKVANAVTPK